MTKWVLWGLAVYYVATGLYIAGLPLVFYENAPGVTETGPYNMHFVRDVGFAFLTSSAALTYGLYHGSKPLMVFGSLWLFVHGLFHLSLWVHHGLHFNQATLVDQVLVTIPAIVLFVLCLRYQPEEAQGA